MRETALQVSISITKTIQLMDQNGLSFTHASLNKLREVRNVLQAEFDNPPQFQGMDSQDEA